MTNADKKIQQAKVGLILDQPFFGALILHLNVKSDSTCKTMWTDGKTLGFNPTYVDDLSLAEVQGVLCHEVLHCANGHPWRRDVRDARQWNEATDLAINPIVVGSGLTLPPSGLIDPQYQNMAAEEIYSRMPKPQPDEQNGQGNEEGNEDGNGNDGDGDSGPGAVRDSPSPDTSAQDQADWQVVVTQAATQAKSIGKLPACLDRYVKELLRPKVDWRTVLHRFKQQAMKADYTWKRPSKRYLASGLYLPTLQSDGMGHVCIGIDISGSISAEEFQQFASEENAVISELKPERTDVFLVDCTIQEQRTFEQDDPITFDHKYVGGGGTDFSPMFEAIKEQGLSPVCAIYLTDGYGPYPDQAPDYPVLWIMTTDKVAPFGETVRMEVTL